MKRPHRITCLVSWLMLIWMNFSWAAVRDTQTLQRTYEPFQFEADIFASDTSGSYIGAPLNEIFAFSYDSSNSVWRQIPLQLDEYSYDSGYLFSGFDNILATTDRGAIMCADLGDRVSENTWIPDLDSRSFPRIEIRGQDTVTGENGWFYLYRSATYTDTLSQDYIWAGEGSTPDIYTNVYTIGYNSRGIWTHLSYPETPGQRGPVEIIDRQKVRIRGKVDYGIFSVSYKKTEDDLNLKNRRIKDGPVRLLQYTEWEIKESIATVTLKTTQQFYQHSSMVISSSKLDSDAGIMMFRSSIDINAAISGATLNSKYNDSIILNLDEDESIVRDLDVPDTFWAQTSSPNGSFLQLIPLETALSEMTLLYYCERTSGTNDYLSDPYFITDSGDMLSYGDIGLLLKDKVAGRAQLAPDLFYFADEADRAKAETLVSHYQNPVVWWGGIQIQSFDGVAPIAIVPEITDGGDDFITLNWTAPGDNGTSDGPVTSYHIRYSTQSPTEDLPAWWDIAESVADAPAPAEPGATESFTITGLTRNQHYYFGIRAEDAAGNLSELTSLVSRQTTPVELAALSAQSVAEGVQITWKTLSESKNYGFEIHRRKVEGEFETIGFVNGAGTTTQPQSYAFLDETVSYGDFEYRLKQIDFNGQFELSTLLKISLTGPSDFALQQNYPNPFNPETTIAYSLKSGADSYAVQLRVFNMLGQEIITLTNTAQTPGKYRIKWDGRNETGEKVSSGVYFYRIQAVSPQSQQNWTETRKMLLLP